MRLALHTIPVLVLAPVDEVTDIILVEPEGISSKDSTRVFVTNVDVLSNTVVIFRFTNY